MYVSESTVYRILKREGLIKPVEIVGFKAAWEYHRKTKRPHELWATDCAYLKVMGWGWYYLVTVMDDFSRFILAWRLQLDMTMERYHRTVKWEINLLPYETPSALEEAIRSFIEYYNYQRYHEVLGDVTPFDVHVGQRQEALQRRKETKSRTLEARKGYNGTVRGRSLDSEVSVISRAKMCHFCRRHTPE